MYSKSSSEYKVSVILTALVLSNSLENRQCLQCLTRASSCVFTNSILRQMSQNSIGYVLSTFFNIGTLSFFDALKNTCRSSIMRKLQLFFVHNKGHAIRKKSLENFSTTMTTIASKVKVSMLTPIVVSEPTDSEIEKNLKEYNDKIEYVKTGDADFDKAMPVLNVPQLANLEKHKNILQAIANSPADANIHYMVAEDDAAILPDFILNMESMLRDIAEYDLLILGLALTTQNASKLFLPIQEIGCKILPSKECFLVRPHIARALVEAMAPIRFDMRTYLSHWIHMNPETNTVIYNKRVCIDGSKLGLCPSTLKNNNVLLFNHEYMTMLKLLQSGELVEVARVRQLYKPIERLQSPDAMHLLGVLLHKAGKNDEAEAAILDAIDGMVRQTGLLNRGSEMIHNYINLCRHISNNKEYDASLAKYSKLYA